MTFGVDYAWGRPGVTALKAAGVKFVCRYLSHDSTGKNLTRVEADKLSAAGIWIVPVWEDTASRALAGRAAGVADAQDAAAQAAACGMPGDRPIFFAVDFDATGQTGGILPYFAGAASVLGSHRVGVYGGDAAVTAVLDAGHATWAWQTYAWSGGAWDPRAQLQQYSNDHIIGGVGLDYDRATVADYGQWKTGVSPSPAPTPAPAQEDDDMPYGQLSIGEGTDTPISWPTGKCQAIGFFADTGLVGAPPVQLRVAYHTGGGTYIVKQVAVDSKVGKAVVNFGADAGKVDAVSVKRLGAETIPVSYDAS